MKFKKGDKVVPDPSKGHYESVMNTLEETFGYQCYYEVRGYNRTGDCIQISPVGWKTDQVIVYYEWRFKLVCEVILPEDLFEI